MGQVMSRDDLAGYFTRAHSKAIPETRTQHPVDPADYTVKFGTNSLVRPPVAAVVTLSTGCSALLCAAGCLRWPSASWRPAWPALQRSSGAAWQPSRQALVRAVCRPAGRGSCCHISTGLALLHR